MTPAHATGWRNWLLSAALLLASGTGAHAAFIPLTATLDGAQETPPNASPGTGSAAFILDDVNRTLITAATFSGLTGTTTSADIEDSTGLIVHLIPAGPTGFPIGVMRGSFTNLWTGLTPGDVAALESGRYFIDIRTTAFSNGEIRGPIVSAAAIPEPASLVLGATGAVALLGVAWLRRRWAPA
jgi:hypothetical protein